jgi:hypothetical protein
MKSTDSKYSSDHITAQLQVSDLPAPPGCGGENDHSVKNKQPCFESKWKNGIKRHAQQRLCKYLLSIAEQVRFLHKPGRFRQKKRALFPFDPVKTFDGPDGRKKRERRRSSCCSF